MHGIHYHNLSDKVFASFLKSVKISKYIIVAYISFVI